MLFYCSIDRKHYIRGQRYPEGVTRGVMAEGRNDLLRSFLVASKSFGERSEPITREPTKKQAILKKIFFIFY